MGLRRRIRRAEEAAEAYRDELTLPDGSTLKLGPTDRGDAFLALLDPDPEKRQHWLLARILEHDPGGREIPEGEEFVRLVIAIGGKHDGT